MKRWIGRCAVGFAAVVLAGVGVSAAAAEKDGSTRKGRVTFTKDVQPIMQKHCQACHRPNGANLGGMVAPMSLTTYAEVRPWAKAIAVQVEGRQMPPWDASPKFHGVFENERTMTQDEINTLVKWVKTGASRGKKKDAPPPIDFPDADGWQIGEPDLIVSMPERYFVADDVEDIYVNFETHLSEEMLPEDRYVKAVEFRPGSPVVHHIISLPLGGIAPGNDPSVHPDGFATELPKGSIVTWQMHYHKEAGPGTGVWDQSSVGIKFYPKGYIPEHQVRIAYLGNTDFEIPAGAANYEATSEKAFDKDIMILSYLPHMHLRGKSARYVAHLPDDTSEALLDVPEYDFNWQTTYRYAKPKVVPAGSRIELTMAWDNSADNPFNPDPTRSVRFGEPTTDEMMFGFMSYAFVEEPELVKIAPEVLAGYAGTYRVQGEDRSVEFHIQATETRLLVKFYDQGPFPLSAVAENAFVLAIANVKLTFGEAADTEARRVDITMQGEEFTATRVELAEAAEVE